MTPTFHAPAIRPHQASRKRATCRAVPKSWAPARPPQSWGRLPTRVKTNSRCRASHFKRGLPVGRVPIWRIVARPRHAWRPRALPPALCAGQAVHMSAGPPRELSDRVTTCTFLHALGRPSMRWWPPEGSKKPHCLGSLLLPPALSLLCLVSPPPRLSGAACPSSYRTEAQPLPSAGWPSKALTLPLSCNIPSVSLASASAAWADKRCTRAFFTKPSFMRWPAASTMSR